jgi:hypothetical protein
MIQEAWKVAFPSLRFPVELIVVFPSRKSSLVAAPHKASDQQTPASQVRKHNKRYLLTKHLIRGVFAEWETGQAVAQLLKGGNEEMSLRC